MRRSLGRFVFLLTLVSGFLPMADAHAASIHGRVWLNTTPTPGVRIRVFDMAEGKLLATTASKGYSGADSASYRVDGLPEKKELVVEAVYMLFQKQPGVTTVTLSAGEDRKVNLTVGVNSPTTTNSLIERTHEIGMMNNPETLPTVKLESPRKLQGGWDGKVSGKVTGPVPTGARLVLYFKTDKTYEQGSYNIGSSGPFAFNKTHATKGSKHTVWVVLMDSNGVIYSQDMVFGVKAAK